MPDEEKKIIVDDDWKAEAKREKERLAQEVPEHGPLPAASLTELIELITTQVLVGLGLFAGPRGERIPPNLEAAKHFIDLLQVLEDKTKNNLTPEEKQILDRVLYDLRMSFVQLASAGSMPPPSSPPPPAPAP